MKYKKTGNESRERQASRKMMAGYFKDNPVKDGKDINATMREMMSVILEGALDSGLDEELGYYKYDYRNKDINNRCNGHSKKTMHTGYGDMNFEDRLEKSNNC